MNSFIISSLANVIQTGVCSLCVGSELNCEIIIYLDHSIDIDVKQQSRVEHYLAFKSLRFFVLNGLKSLCFLLLLYRMSEKMETEPDVSTEEMEEHLKSKDVAKKNEEEKTGEIK